MISIARRRFLQLGVAAAVSLPGGVRAERQARIFMVLGRGEGANEKSFREGLARRGIKAEYIVRDTGGDASKLPGIVEEIRAAKPDLIYTWGTPQTLGVVGRYDDPNPAKFIRNIPVVFTFVADPVDAKIVRSLEKPGGSVTGTMHIAPVAAQVNAIQTYRPIKKLGVVYNPGERNAVLAVDQLKKIWAERGLQLIQIAAPLKDGKPDAQDIPALMERCKREGAEMLYIGPDTFMASINRKRVAEIALELKLPTFSVTEPIVRTDGAMFALSSSNVGIGRLTSIKAAQILLEGKPPGDVPVERLRRFSVIINMNTVRVLSYYPPIGLLNFAEMVGV